MADPNAFMASLPPVNGTYEAGVTVGSDAALADGDKLAVYDRLTGGTFTANQRHQYRAYSSALWAYRKQDYAVIGSREFYVAGAFSAVFFGLLGVTGNTPDGDWTGVTVDCEPPTDEEKGALATILTVATVRSALTIQIAGKANWYMTNHHTGESMNQASGYMRKALHVIIPQASRDQVKMAHTISHWCSTIIILRRATIARVRPDTLEYIDHPAAYILSADATLRFAALPAGVHKIAICAIAAKKLINHELIRYWRGTNDLLNAINAMPTIRAEGAAYHVGARYLAAVPTIGNFETEANAVQGRLAAFMRTFFLASTVCESPHFTKQAMESAPDYDPTWLTLCINWKTATARAYENIQIQTAAEHDAQTIAQLRAQVNLN